MSRLMIRKIGLHRLALLRVATSFTASELSASLAALSNCSSSQGEAPRRADSSSSSSGGDHRLVMLFCTAPKSTTESRYDGSGNGGHSGRSARGSAFRKIACGHWFLGRYLPSKAIDPRTHIRDPASTKVG